MNDEAEINAEMRLFALESVVCQHLAALYQTTLPREIFDAVRKRGIEGAKQQTFPGVDAVQSDLLSAELQNALERLYGMIQSNLEIVQRGRTR
jgi:hypothetical protein